MKKIILFCGLAFLILSLSAYALPTSFQSSSSSSRGEMVYNGGQMGNDWNSNFNRSTVDFSVYHHSMRLKSAQNMTPVEPQCPVPEPMTLTLFGLGALGLSLIRKPNK
jgi:PEP-CTERM motif